MHRKILTLHDLNKRIKYVIEDGFPETYLITAEIATQRIDQKGHCYLEFVERDKEFIIAQIRATIWSSTFRIISQQFKSVTGMPITKGIKVLVEVEVSYHERYGLSLNVLDIDPSYTLGEMALKRKEILERLSLEGLIGKNKEISFPVLPLNVAVISSPSAAGYEDFVNHLRYNPFAYSYKIRLFSAIMQGNRSEDSVLNALKICSENHELFDIIVIIRGGGGEADLHCFDSYAIGRSIAHMPLPVISGIGHQRDRTVVDEVANTTVKTPTAAAELIIHTVRNFELRVNESGKRLIDTARAGITDNTVTLHAFSRDIEKNVMHFLTLEESALERCIKYLTAARKIISSHYERMENRKVRCVSHSKHKIREHRNAIVHFTMIFKQNSKKLLLDLNRSLKENQKHISLLNPVNILKRGYSITYKNGGLVKDIQNICAGDIIRTVVHKGTIKSRVCGVNNNGKEKTAEV